MRLTYIIAILVQHKYNSCMNAWVAHICNNQEFHKEIRMTIPLQAVAAESVDQYVQLEKPSHMDHHNHDSR